MKRIILAAAIALAGCTNADGTRRVLEAQGFTNIEVKGYSLFGCSKDDTYHTAFEATGPSGKRVSGVVCAGLFFKGATVRFD